jgi:hypothetical protein
VSQTRDGKGMRQEIRRRPDAHRQQQPASASRATPAQDSRQPRQSQREEHQAEYEVIRMRRIQRRLTVAPLDDHRRDRRQHGPDKDGGHPSTDYCPGHVPASSARTAGGTQSAP